MLDYSCYYPTFKVTKSTCPLSLRYFVCYRHDSVGTRLTSDLNAVIVQQPSSLVRDHNGSESHYVTGTLSTSTDGTHANERSFARRRFISETFTEVLQSFVQRTGFQGGSINPERGDQIVMECRAVCHRPDLQDLLQPTSSEVSAHKTAHRFIAASSNIFAHIAQYAFTQYSSSRKRRHLNETRKFVLRLEFAAWIQ